MLGAQTTARQLSGELWIKANQHEAFGNKLLGKTLGKLQYEQYAPLKRLTDLMSKNLIGISSIHQKGLLIVLDNMIGVSNKKPIKGVKKLLELFLELLHQFPGYQMLRATTLVLAALKETKSLKSIINKIEKAG